MKKIFFAAILAGLLFTSFTQAQYLNMMSKPDDFIKTEISFKRGNYSFESGLSTFSGNYNLEVNIPVSPSFNIIANLPFNISRYEYSEFNNEGIGNIFLGAQYKIKKDSEGINFFTFGLNLPTIERDNSGLFMTNIYEIGDFAPDNISLYTNYSQLHYISKGTRLGFETGLNFLIPTEDNNDTELYVHYGFNASQKIFGDFLLSAELLGIAIITQDVDDFGDRFIHQLNFGAQWEGSWITPKLFYGIYLEDPYNDIFDGVVGAGVSIKLN